MTWPGTCLRASEGAAGGPASQAPCNLILVVAWPGEASAEEAEALKAALQVVPPPRQVLLLVEAWGPFELGLAQDILSDPVLLGPGPDLLAQPSAVEAEAPAGEAVASQEDFDDLRLLGTFMANILCRSRNPAIREQALRLLPPPRKRKAVGDPLEDSSASWGINPDAEETALRDGVAELLLCTRVRAQAQAKKAKDKPEKAVDSQSMHGRHSTKRPKAPRDLEESESWWTAGAEEELPVWP